jgi:peptide chain release factor 1
MLDKLREIEKKYVDIENRMAQPEVYSDPAAYARCAREQKELSGVVEAYRRYVRCQTDMAEARELMADPEMKEMAQEEFDRARSECEQVEAELKKLLLPRDPNDSRNVIMEIRGGAGGEEAALFAHSLYRMYSMYADAKRWKLEVANLNETEIGGIKEVSFIIEGEGAYSRLKYESGVHRVQRVPETETAGRIHTSTVTVAVLPEMDEVEFEINPADLQIDTFRSSGAGGQHVNKTESAIRITHLPTGTVVECQDERSQHKNRDRAMKILASRLYEAEQRKQRSAQAAERKSQVGTGDRSERIRTYNFPQGRVTDHRIGLTLYKIEQIMDGALDEIIDALAAADQAEKLRAQGEE